MSSELSHIKWKAFESRTEIKPKIRECQTCSMFIIFILCIHYIPSYEVTPSYSYILTVSVPHWSINSKLMILCKSKIESEKCIVYHDTVCVRFSFLYLVVVGWTLNIWSKPKTRQEMNVNAQLWLCCEAVCVRAEVAYCKCLFRWYEYQSCCHMIRLTTATDCHSDRTDKKTLFLPMPNLRNSFWCSLFGSICN